MIAIKKPFYWVSAHRDVNFTFEYSNTYPLLNVIGSDGFAVFAFTGDGLNSVPIGGYIYIDSGFYKGYHKVIEYFLYDTWYKTETAFDVDGFPVVSGNLTMVTNGVFELYSGYESGDLATLLPYTKIAEFAPEPNLDGQLVVNISGYINKIFDVINSNGTTTIGASTVYYNLFNKVTLIIDGAFQLELMALNSAITSLELNRDYVDTGRSLNGGNLGNHYFSCGESQQIIIDGSLVVNGSTFDGGSDDTVVLIFSPTDFANSDFVTG